MVWSLVWTWPLAGVGVARSWYEEAGYLVWAWPAASINYWEGHELSPTFFQVMVWVMHVRETSMLTRL